MKCKTKWTTMRGRTDVRADDDIHVVSQDPEAKFRQGKTKHKYTAIV